MKKQLELQEEIISKTGLNLVTCGNCGSTIIHNINDTVIVCNDCGCMSEPCDFPDLNISGTERESQHPLASMVLELPRILDDVYLNDDDNESNSVVIHVDNRHHINKVVFFSVDIDNNIRIWELTKEVICIAHDYRNEILTSRLGKFDKDETVSLSDIFMYGKFNKEITTDEYLKLVEKRFIE